MRPFPVFKPQWPEITEILITEIAEIIGIAEEVEITEISEI